MRCGRRPAGTIVGATVGAVAGGLAGKGIAEAIDPTVEEGHCRANYASRPYVMGGSSFDALDSYGSTPSSSSERSSSAGSR